MAACKVVARDEPVGATQRRASLATGCVIRSTRKTSAGHPPIGDLMPRLQMVFDWRRAPFSPIDHSAMAHTMLEQCSWADRIGFDTVVLGEHHGTDDGYLPSALVAAAAIAGATRHLRLRPMVMAPFRDPLQLAEDLAVLDLVSQGRLTPLILGGYVKSEFAMFDVATKERPALVTECVEVLKQAWTGEPFQFRGRTVRVTPRPHQHPRPAIMLGGSSVQAARRAALIGDQFLPGERGFWKDYVDECIRIGRDPGPHNRSGPIFCYVAEDPDRAWHEVGPYVLYQVQSYGAWARQNRNRDSETFPAAETIDDLKQNPAYQIVTPAECIELAEGWEPDGSLLLHPLIAGLPPDLGWSHLDLFERKVVPHINITAPGPARVNSPRS